MLLHFGKNVIFSGVRTFLLYQSKNDKILKVRSEAKTPTLYVHESAGAHLINQIMKLS
jgi:hypothetical protein